MLNVPESEGAVVPSSRPNPEQQINVGELLTTIDNHEVIVVEIKGDTFRCNDNIWRYDRNYENERGRVTGTHSFPPHPKSIAKYHTLKHPRKVVEALASCPKFTRRSQHVGGKTIYDSAKLMRQVCENLDTIFEYEAKN